MSVANCKTWTKGSVPNDSSNCNDEAETQKHNDTHPLRHWHVQSHDNRNGKSSSKKIGKTADYAGRQSCFAVIQTGSRWRELPICADRSINSLEQNTRD
jgi:hypothetical protein